MSKEEFANKPSISTGDALNPTTQINNPATGVQTELELRQGDWLDGVTSGMTCTTSSTNIAIASGRAYVGGNRYSGNATVSFTGAAAGDYYVYIDSADDNTPYKKKTAAPTSGELTLCTCTWGGSVFTTPYIDDNRKVLGIERRDIPFGWDGTLAVGKEYHVPVRDNLWIESLDFMCSDNGSISGSVTVDVHLGADGSSGTTIFTTQARRPSISTSTAGYTIAASGEPDGDRKPDAGEHLTFFLDTIDGGGTATTLTGILRCRAR